MGSPPHCLRGSGLCRQGAMRSCLSDYKTLSRSHKITVRWKTFKHGHGRENCSDGPGDHLHSSQSEPLVSVTDQSEAFILTPDQSDRRPAGRVACSSPGVTASSPPPRASITSFPRCRRSAPPSSATPGSGERSPRSAAASGQSGRRTG